MLPLKAFLLAVGVLLFILIVSGLICYFLSNFISNTATAALLMPILAVVCRAMGDKLDVIGGTSTVLLGVAIAASTECVCPSLLRRMPLLTQQVW